MLKTTATLLAFSNTRRHLEQNKKNNDTNRNAPRPLKTNQQQPGNYHSLLRVAAAWSSRFCPSWVNCAVVVCGAVVVGVIRHVITAVDIITVVVAVAFVAVDAMIDVSYSCFCCYRHPNRLRHKQ